MSDWLYATACVLGPALWGVAMYWLFNMLDRRRARADRQSHPPVDYSI